MTKITDISQLKVGDEVTLTVKGRISHVYTDPDDNYANLDFEEHAEYISISKEYLDDGLMTIVRDAQPLPSEDGVYVPANNASFVSASYLYRLREGEWTQIFGNAIKTEAKGEAEYAHNSLGGLVLLVAGH